MTGTPGHDPSARADDPTTVAVARPNATVETYAHAPCPLALSSSTFSGLDVDAIVAALAEQHVELARLLDGLEEQGWQRPSRCDGWTVSDVVLHLAQTNEMAIGSATGRFAETIAELTGDRGRAESIDDGADQMVARDRGQPGDAVRARWQASSARLREVLAATDPHARVTWVAGELSARTLATTRLAETWIHTGDVAFAFGAEPDPSDRLWHIARLAWRTLPYAFEREGRAMTGPVSFELVGPNGDAWSFGTDDSPRTTITGPAIELVMVASRRVDPRATTLEGDGPDAVAVLELVRTWA